MKLLTAAAMAAMLLMTTLAVAQEDQKTTDAKAAAVRWLTLADQGSYGAAWDQGAAALRTAVNRTGFEDALKSARTPLGAVRARTQKSAVYTKSAPGAAEAEFIVIQYVTEFEHQPNALETVTPMREKDGSWRVSGYYIQ